MWNISSASAQGPQYYNEGKNNQDYYKTFVDKKMAISIICDGCHGGESSEVVARLSAPFLVRKAKELLSNGLSLKHLPMVLFDVYLEYLISLVQAESFRTLEEVSSFISENLMCTIIGAVAYKGKVLLFNCGDGSYFLNDKVFLVKISPHERPSYPAYILFKTYGIIDQNATEIVDEEGKVTKIPEGFDVITLNEKDVNLLGIASDGLNRYSNLFEELATYATSNGSLLLCMNRIVTFREETTDNITVSFLERIGVTDG